MKYLLAPVALIAVTACTTTPSGYSEGDPLEGYNRAMYSFNDAIDGAVIKPVAQGYRAVLPAPVRTGVTNALDNVDEPLSFFNALLQGKIKRAFRAVDRFAINSTYGMLGTTDRAAELGLEKQEEDFGQTLATWGVGSGPYIVLPLLGPSSLRDTVGFGVDSFTDPWPRFQDRTLGMNFEERLGVTGLEVIELRARLLETADPLIENALDPYATVKSAYIQTRTAEIFDGNPPTTDEGFEEMEEFEPFEEFSADETSDADDGTDPAPESE